MEKAQESGIEKGNPTKEAALTQLTICDGCKDEKDGIPREEIETSESEAGKENTAEEYLEGPEGEEDEEETWLDEETRGPIVQTWSNPFYNPDPPRSNYLSSGEINRGNTKQTDRKEVKKVSLREENPEAVEPEEADMGTT